MYAVLVLDDGLWEILSMNVHYELACGIRDNACGRYEDAKVARQPLKRTDNGWEGQQ